MGRFYRHWWLGYIIRCKVNYVGVMCEWIHFNFISLLYISDASLHYILFFIQTNCFIPLFDFFCLYLCDIPVTTLTFGINNTDIISYQLFFSTCGCRCCWLKPRPDVNLTDVIVPLYDGFSLQASDKCAKKLKMCIYCLLKGNWRHLLFLLGFLRSSRETKMIPEGLGLSPLCYW